MNWYNYATGAYDTLDKPTTDEQAEQYIPQGPGISLYRIYRQHYDLPILEAMIKVLTAACQKKED